MHNVPFLANIDYLATLPSASTCVDLAMVPAGRQAPMPSSRDERVFEQNEQGDLSERLENVCTRTVVPF